MRNIKLIIEYDGTEFAGWQVQKGRRTVQGLIERALQKVLGERVNLIASGRTDSGVHALGQAANFKTNSKLAAEKIKKALNANLADDVVVKDCSEVPLRFNARYCAKAKLYRYAMYNGPGRLAISRQYAYRVPYRLSVGLMKKEAKALTGRRNFKSFHASGRPVKNFVRHIRRIDVKKDKNNFVYIDIEANGFLYNMARNIVGTLVEVGRGRLPLGSAQRILNAKDRRAAGPTMPAKGLCLMKVTFFIVLCLLTAGAGLAANEETINITSSYADARLFNNNGVDFVSQGRYEEAAREFQKAIAIDPDFHIARYNLALAYYNIGRAKEAITEFEYLINGSYYFVNAHYNLGTIYLREGMTDKATEQLKIVAELEPNHAEAHFNLGYIYYKKNLLDDAMAEYQKGLAIKPDTIRGRLSLAFIYEKQGRLKEALDEYQAAVETDPDSADAKQALGGLQAIMGLRDKLCNSPKDPSAYIYLGHIYYARGMYQEALDNYNLALRYDPKNSLAKTSADKAVVQLFASQDNSAAKRHSHQPASQ